MPKDDARPTLPHLRAWRMYALLSQKQLADRAGVGVATIIRLERGEHANYLTVQRLANALGISARRLTDEPPRSIEHELE
jgi:transcriptional regulator with XRE-family HTH domain